MKVGFSLADEARQTSQQDHSSSWGANLRSRPVNFISGGPIEPLKQLEELLGSVTISEVTGRSLPDDVQGVPEHDDLNRAYPEPHVSTSEDKILPSVGLAEQSDTSEIIGPEELEKAIQGDAPQQHTCFFIDTTREKGKSMIPPQTEFTHETPELKSESDEDIILFKGRYSRKSPSHGTSSIEVSKPRSEYPQISQQTTITLSNIGKKSKKKKRTPRSRRNKADILGSSQHNIESDSDDAILADYISNMQDSGGLGEFMMQTTFQQRDLGGSEPVGDSSDDEITETREADGTKSGNMANQAEPKGQETESTSSDTDDNKLAQLLASKDLGFNLNTDLGDESPSIESPQEHPKAYHPDGSVDPSDDFDFMEWERPSLQRKRKGKGAQMKLNVQLSDSELEQSLQRAFKADRMKKAQRKKQREELRALGMLGKSAANPDDLMVKYPNGISIEEVAGEMRSFLLSPEQT